MRTEGRFITEETTLPRIAIWNTFRGWLMG